MTKSNVKKFQPWTNGELAKESDWKKVEQWNDVAKMLGTRYIVHCSVIPDLFFDDPELLRSRARLINLFGMTSLYLEWNLWTRNPECIKKTLESTRDVIIDTINEPYWYAKGTIDYWLNGKQPINVKLISSGDNDGSKIGLELKIQLNSQGEISYVREKGV